MARSLLCSTDGSSGPSTPDDVSRGGGGESDKESRDRRSHCVKGTDRHVFHITQAQGHLLLYYRGDGSILY